jgi:predicted phage terminase large subunit-like protein
VVESKARFKVVVCGRQFGKTSLGAAMVVLGAAAGGDYGWVAPSFRVGELGWAMIRKLSNQINAETGGVKVQERPVYRITFPSGGSIQMWSSEHPDSLRGMTLDGVVFDEAALARPEAWPTLRPTLSVRRGWAIFISTPKGLNWFYDLYENAAHIKNWERWRIPSAENPHLPADDIETAKGEMSSLMFAQEYMAEFIATGSGIFRADYIQHYAFTQGEPLTYMFGPSESVLDEDLWKFHTVDLAWSMDEGADFTVISTWGVTPRNHILLLDMVRGRFEGPDLIPRLRYAFERWGGYLVVERASRGLAILQEAERVGLPIKEVKPDKNKLARAAPAAARMEQGRLWFPPTTTPWWREIEEEMLAFPAGAHDDFVDTLAYAVIEAADQSSYGDHRLFTV